MKELTDNYRSDKYEFIKNPVIAEFLGFATNTDFTESELEKSIISNIQNFMMELGKGYEADVIRWRRELHRFPELGGQEYRTAALVEEHAKKLGLTVLTAGQTLFNRSSFSAI